MQATQANTHTRTKPTHVQCRCKQNLSPRHAVRCTLVFARADAGAPLAVVRPGFGFHGNFIEHPRPLLRRYVRMQPTRAAMPILAVCVCG